MKLRALFERCLYIPYTHVENAADYATEHLGNTLYIYFEASNGIEDWKNNLSFPARPYRRMGRTAWFAHRGFLKVWKTLEEYIAPMIADPTLKRIVTVGYSHGAALAVLCHEYIWYHRPDLKNSIEGYGFGCPRVVWGCASKAKAQRWERFTVIRNINDVVTHLPPSWLGFSHVGMLLEIGERGKYTMIDAHRPENILTELEHREHTLAARPGFIRWDTKIDPALIG